MHSIFEKASTRMFCISGVLNDIYCMPDLRMLNFEEFLNEKLHMLGYQNVVFYSGAKRQFFTLDAQSRAGLEVLKKQPAPKTAPPPPPTPADSPAKPPQQRGGMQRQRRVADPEKKPEVYAVTISDETQTPETANRFMLDTTTRKALVFTSLEDFISNVDKSRRGFHAYFEDWKSLPSENGNICIFLSKSIDARNLQRIFGEQGTLPLQSLFVRGMTSGGAEFNHNACMIVGSPLNDEIASLLEYLRIKGYTYRTRDAQNQDVTVTAHLQFRYAELDTLLRSLNFYNRESEFSELKTMKETLERFMQDHGGTVVPLTPADVPKLYPRSHGTFQNEQDPMEFLRTRRGWEAAHQVLNSFILSHRKAQQKLSATIEERGQHDIDRIEPVKREFCGKVPNFVLQGPPGVGKTEIANLIGRILQKEGILKSGHTVIGSRDKLVGQFVGSTAIQTAALIEQAQEGVLLIDEVYSLAEGNANSGVNYCAEVFNTLVAAMTNQNYHFCIIFAGYADRMNEVWQMNEGLFSRFGDANIIDLQGYEPDLLQSIFESFFPEGEEVQLSDTVRQTLPLFFQNYYADRDRVNFGNARDVGNLAATVKRAAAFRAIQQQEEGIVYVQQADFGERAALFAKRGKTADDIYASIYDYVGLEFLVNLFNDQLSEKVECEEKNLVYPGPSHMVWVGDPGTGKSTAAQLTAELYHSLGILGGTKPIYVDASELISSHVGGSAEAVQRRMDEACQHNTILVVEEAHQLCTSSMGKEVIDAMLNRMENERQKFNVIFVVYQSKLDDFLAINPGMPSRVNVCRFPSYTAPQLTAIFQKMCEKHQDTYTPDTLVQVEQLLTALHQKGITRKGNARLVRQLLEQMRKHRYRRILGEMAAAIHGEDTPENRGRVAAARAMHEVAVPASAYCFTPADIPADFGSGAA